MDMTLIKSISKLVEQACDSEQDKMEYALWKYRIKPMILIAQA